VNLREFFRLTLAGLISGKGFSGGGHRDRIGACDEYIHGSHIDGIINFLRVGVLSGIKNCLAPQKIHQNDSTNLTISIISIRATDSLAFSRTELFSQDEENERHDGNRGRRRPR
jgi:hypothetical protein